MRDRPARANNCGTNGKISCVESGYRYSIAIGYTNDDVGFKRITGSCYRIFSYRIHN